MRRITFIIAAWVFLSGPTTSAATGSAPEAQADEMVRRALDLRRQGKNAEALDLLRKAQTLAPSSRTLAQVGSAEFALQLWVDAETHLRQALAGQDSAWIANPRNRQMLERSLAEARRHVAQLDFRGSSGARVLIDGRDVGALPLAAPVRVAAGTVRVSASAPGRQTYERVLTVAAGEQTAIALDLAPLPASPVATHPLVGRSKEEARTPAWRRWTGGGLIIAGLAAIGTGVTWVAIDGRGNCSAPPGGFCEQFYSTKTQGWIAVAGGAIGAGVGATLFLWKGGEADAGLAFGPGSFAVRGTF